MLESNVSDRPESALDVSLFTDVRDCDGRGLHTIPGELNFCGTRCAPPISLSTWANATSARASSTIETERGASG